MANEFDPILDNTEKEDYQLTEISNGQYKIIAELERIRGDLHAAKDWLKVEIAGLILGLVILAFASSWPGSWLDRWTDRVWYSLRYSTDYGNVIVSKRPSDCDFLRTPIGDKGCEYKKQTSVFGPNERQELAKTAENQEQLRKYEEMPNSVQVYWNKKED